MEQEGRDGEDEEKAAVHVIPEGINKLLCVCMCVCVCVCVCVCMCVCVFWRSYTAI